MIIRLGIVFLLLGAAFVLIGLLAPAASRVPFLSWLGRLPGDLRIERPGGVFFFPITSCVVVSVVLTFLFRALRFLLPRL